jgi:hypothetical protein
MMEVRISRITIGYFGYARISTALGSRLRSYLDCARISTALDIRWVYPFDCAQGCVDKKL